nr:hypothetical protein [Noviherbaspirillum sp. UKPF54]
MEIGIGSVVAGSANISETSSEQLTRFDLRSHFQDPIGEIMSALTRLAAMRLKDSCRVLRSLMFSSATSMQLLLPSPQGAMERLRLNHATDPFLRIKRFSRRGAGNVPSSNFASAR